MTTLEVANRLVALCRTGQIQQATMNVFGYATLSFCRNPSGLQQLRSHFSVLN